MTNKTKKFRRRLWLAHYEITKKKNKKISWRVAHDITLHIDDAPVVRLHKGICNREGGGGRVFFQQDPANHDYLKASESSKKDVPGYNHYFAKLGG